MKKIILPLLIVSLFLLTSCSVFGVRSGYKEVPYEITAAIDEVEIRNYPSRVIVEVSNETERNKAFYKLFDYISGQNTAQESISMTTPVQMKEDASQKISMTAPVEINEDENSEGMMMRFFLPESFTIDNAPKPNDPDVTLIELPAQTFAVLRYSGSTSKEKFIEKKAELLSLLEPSPWKVIGPVTFMGYDPPFTIPFLKRNEVVVPVEK